MSERILRWVEKAIQWPWSPKTNDLAAFLLIQCALAGPALVASSMIVVPQVLVPLEPVASQLGYTWSLGLFGFPCFVFGLWAWKVVKESERWWALGLTVIVLSPIGILLDLLFGRLFFTFEAKHSVLWSVYGEEWFRWWAYKSPGRGIWAAIVGVFNSENWERYIPVEEILFYTMGFTTILLVYVWADAALFRRDKVDLSQHTPRFFRTMWRSFWSCLAIGAALVGIAREFQQWLNVSEFPGYFTFLVACSVVPTFICIHVAYHFVNWRALTVAWLFILVISQFWEGSLGVPYQWWGYQKDQMIGWGILPQCALPLEAVLVWSLASWATVMVFETILAAFELPGAAAVLQRGAPLVEGTAVRGEIQQPTRTARAKARLRAAKNLVVAPSESGAIQEVKRRFHEEGQSKQSKPN